MRRDWHRNCYDKRAMSTQTQTYRKKGFTLTLSHDGETIYADIEKGVYSGTLACAENSGAIENDEWTRSLEVPEDVIEYFQDMEQKFSELIQ